jgi:hypothetical protein
MKKILILMLVLGLASSANAALTLVSSAGNTLVDGDSTRIGIYNDTAAAGQGLITWVVIDVSGPGAWKGDDETFYSPPSLGPGGTSLYYGVLGPGDTGLPYTADLWYSDAAVASPDPYGVGVLVDYGFNCTGLGDVDIYLLADDLSTVLDKLTITQIPEPMTIALLGLGSLFLLRRRK